MPKSIGTPTTGISSWRSLEATLGHATRNRPTHPQPSPGSSLRQGLVEPRQKARWEWHNQGEFIWRGTGSGDGEGKSRPAPEGAAVPSVGLSLRGV
jgi:hypothetical protein